MKKFPGVFFILIGATAIIYAQSPETNLSQTAPVKVKPFKIETGSSFSASIPNKNPGASASGNSAENIRAAVSQDFSNALDIIRAHYVDAGKLSLSELTKSSLTAMLRSLDPHSNYFDAPEFQELLSDEQSQYSGIGASIANFTRNGRTDTFITSTFPESPAARAGLHFGDKIISVNSEKMSDKTSLEVRGKIRGLKGSMASLVVERAFSGQLETIEIRRAVVPQPSIPDAYLLRPGIGYIDLTNGFNYTTADEFSAALNNLHNQGMTSLILDLRGNPGGIVEQSVKVAEKFLPAGQTILTQRGRVESDNRTWKSVNKNPENAALVLLVNGGSASASEIVTGALQDCDRALIIGEKTFGKGLVQSVLDLPGGAGLTLTTARYYTPSGRSIQRDYSRGNLYDYFQHRADFENSASQSPSKTVTGRNVFGGDGILPDEKIKPVPLTQSQITLLDPLFFFARQLANGRVDGFENYRTDFAVKYGKRIKPSDFSTGDEVINAFKNYLNQEKINISAGEFAADRKFIAMQIRYYLITAAFGSVTANQVLMENDVEVLKAVDALPRAGNLALTARKIERKK